MRGSLKRLGDNHWRLTYDLKNGDQRKQRVMRFHGTKRQAEAKLAELVAQARGGYRGTTQLVQQYLDGWIDSRSLAPTTTQNYRDFVRLYIAPHIGQYGLEDCTPHDFQTLYATLLKEGGRNKKRLSPLVVRNVHGLLNAAFADAATMGLLPFNPVGRVRSPGNTQQRKPEVLDATALRACVHALQQTPYGFLAWLAAITGLRRGELLGLHGSDVRVDEGFINVRCSVDRLGNLKAPKNGKPRLVPLPLDVHTKARIEDYVRDHPGRLFDFAPAGLSRSFGEACAHVGFPGVHLHTFRHTVASILMKSKVHPKAIQELLGHHDVRFTMSQYSHLLPGMYEDTTQPLGDLVRDQTVITEAENQPDRVET